MKSIFVTGTDTEIGKTRVASAMIRHLVESGQTVAPMKPVASGASGDPLRNDDALELIAASGRSWPYDHVNPYCFEPAIAPHFAAENAGVEIDLGHIAQVYDSLDAQSDRVVVEGAGGWCVPLNQENLFPDLVRQLDLPVMLVVGIRLGCLNHAMLSVREILRSRCPLLGWIANHVEEESAESYRMIKTLERWLPVPRAASMAYGAETLAWEMRL